MGDRPFSLNRTGSGEKHMVSMLLVQALFLGIFLGAFDISAHSLFLSVFDEKMLAKGYIVSGFAGIILFSFYSLFRDRFRNNIFLILILAGVAAITFLLWLLLNTARSPSMIFALFVLQGPLNMLALSGFRASVINRLGLAREKRAFVNLDSGLIAGMIISCFGIPFLLFLSFPLQHFILVAAIALVLAGMVQSITAEATFNGGQDQNGNAGVNEPVISDYRFIRNDKYKRILGFFIVLSVISALFIQYSFLAVTRIRFPQAEDLARFLGIFTGSIMIITLIGKLVLFSFILRNYGLRVCLAISPVLLAVFTLMAVILGMTLGYTSETASGFMIFFILLAATRFLSRSMDESITSSSVRILCQTAGEKPAIRLQSLLGGTVRESSAFLAGLILAGLGLLSIVKLIHFSWVLILILTIWFFTAIRLYREHRESIRKSLESLADDDSSGDSQTEEPEYKNRFAGERILREDYFNLISGDLTTFHKTRNKFYFRKLIGYAFLKKDLTLLPLIKKMPPLVPDEETKQEVAALLPQIDAIAADWKKGGETVTFANKLLAETRMPQTTEILRLLRDKSIESKRLAIFLIGKFRLTDMITEVCECLSIPGLESDTTAVLRAFGSTCEEELMRFYLVSSGNINISKTILRLLAQLSLSEGKGFLFSRLWSSSRQLKEVAVKCLAEARFKPTAEDRQRLNMLISEVNGIISWNLSARKCLVRHNNRIILAEMDSEIKRWTTFQINLLSVTYGSGPVDRILRNLEAGTVESIHYAHSVIDIVFDESVRDEIICLLDNVPDDEKLKNLGRFFPVAVTGYEKLLEEILNRDYNLLSLWTKACVLRDLSGIGDIDMAESVVALLFSPENILQEEAARLIARSDIRLYRSVSGRLPLPTRKYLEKIINGETDPGETLYEKIKFLSAYFADIVEDELMVLARATNLMSDVSVASETFTEGCIIWSRDGGTSRMVKICYQPLNKLLTEEFNRTGASSFYVLPLPSVDNFLYHFPDYVNSIMKFVEKYEI